MFAFDLIEIFMCEIHNAITEMKIYRYFCCYCRLSVFLGCKNTHRV